MLNALSTSISSIISLFLQTLRLAALLPALCFVVVNQFVVPQILGLDPEATKELQFLQQPVWTILITMIVGYTLSALNIPIIRFFEGYSYRFTRLGEYLTNMRIMEKRRLKSCAEFYSAFLQASQELLSDEATVNKLRNGLYPAIYAALGEANRYLEDSFPGSDAAVLPTDLGNSIAVFEEYPRQRYSIDAVALWAHMLPVLSEQQYSGFVEREKATLDFMLNMSVLTAFLAAEAITLVAMGYGLPIWVAFILSSLAYFVFYRGSVIAARNWGEAVKTAFDLYRYELAARLSLRPVWSMSEETTQWKRLSSFLRGFDEGCVGYDYPLPKSKSEEL